LWRATKASFSGNKDNVTVRSSLVGLSDSSIDNKVARVTVPACKGTDGADDFFEAGVAETPTTFTTSTTSLEPCETTCPPWIIEECVETNTSPGVERAPPEVFDTKPPSSPFPSFPTFFLFLAPPFPTSTTSLEPCETTCPPWITEECVETNTSPEAPPEEFVDTKPPSSSFPSFPTLSLFFAASESVELSLFLISSIPFDG